MKLAGAAAAVILAPASLWGSMHLASLSRVPGAYTDIVATWAYFLFLFFIALVLSAVALILKAANPTGKLVTVVAGLAAALASFLAMQGVLFGIASMVGGPIFTGMATPILLVVAIASIALYWRLVRAGGVGTAAAIAGVAFALLFTPLYVVGPFLFCGQFTPNVRCI